MSSQPHAGFFEWNDAIPAQFLAHAQTFDLGGRMGSKENLESRALSAKRERVEIIESPNHGLIMRNDRDSFVLCSFWFLVAFLFRRFLRC